MKQVRENNQTRKPRGAPRVPMPALRAGSAMVSTVPVVAVGFSIDVPLLAAGPKLVSQQECDALSSESRLRTLQRREALFDREVATCIRKVWESDLPAELGYSYLRDFAREELSSSVKACQELVRLDRALDSLPVSDAMLRSGSIRRSKLQALLPVLDPGNERTWLRRALGKTVSGLQEWIRAEQRQDAEARESSGARSGEQSAPGAPPETMAEKPFGTTAGAPPEVNVVLRQQTPLRSRLVWEAAREEVSKRTGQMLSDGDAHELYLAEFWAIVPPEIRARIQPVHCWPPKFCTEYRVSTPSADIPAYVYSDPTKGEGSIQSPGSCDTNGPTGSDYDWFRSGVLPSQTDGKSFVTAPAVPWDAWKEDRRKEQETDWLESRCDQIRMDRASLDRIADQVANDVKVAKVEAARSAATEDRTRRERTTPDNETRSRAARERSTRERTPHEWFALYKRIETSRRKIRLEQGRILARMKWARSYTYLGFSEFGHYTRERLEMGRRAADERVSLARIVGSRPVLRRAYREGRLLESHLVFLRRLLGAGVTSHEEIHAWAERAEEVTVKTYGMMIQDALKQVALRDKERCDPNRPNSLAPPTPILPPSRPEWSVLRTESLRTPDVTVTQTGRRQISALAAAKEAAAGTEATAGAETDPESDRVRIDPAVLAAEWVPKPEEHADCTTHIRAPQDVIESYQQAIALLRALYGEFKPAWWCREVLVLLVRRHWASEDVDACKRVERWKIYSRDGFVCAVPTCTGCGTLMSHHIVFLSQLGPDTPQNQISVCAACHLQGIHETGAISVEGTAPDRLIWKLGEQVYDGDGFVIAPPEDGRHATREKPPIFGREP